MNKDTRYGKDFADLDKSLLSYTPEEIEIADRFGFTEKGEPLLIVTYWNTLKVYTNDTNHPGYTTKELSKMVKIVYD